MNLDLLVPNWKQYWNMDGERCGFVLRDGSLVEVENLASDPSNYFLISDESFEEYDGQIFASWHTHTHDSANISMADYETFTTSTLAKHVVVSRKAVAVFSMVGADLMLDGWKLHD